MSLTISNAILKNEYGWRDVPQITSTLPITESSLTTIQNWLALQILPNSYTSPVVDMVNYELNQSGAYFTFNGSGISQYTINSVNDWELSSEYSATPYVKAEISEADATGFYYGAYDSTHDATGYPYIAIFAQVDEETGEYVAATMLTLRSTDTSNTQNTHWQFGDIQGGVSVTFNNSMPSLLDSGAIELDKYRREEEDPYNPGGESGEGGGSGTFDNTSEDIGIPDLPSISAASSGFVTLFNPTSSELQNLAGYMWSTFDVDAFKRMFADPMDCILGLSIVPCNVSTSGAIPVKVGNISTGISMHRAASQYVTVNCGSLRINEYWGGYLDYSPYTKAEIYLPFIGTHPIDIDEIMDKSVQVVYHIDILTGSCIAYIKSGGSVLYQFIGQCSSTIPITSNNFGQIVSGALTIAGSIGAMVATGGLSAPLSAGIAAGALSTSASTVMNMKPDIEKSGSLSGSGGLLGVQKPYIIIKRPRQCKPANQNKYTGYPSYITKTLGDVTGFTVIEEIFLDNIPATDSEKDEIMALLKEGVVL